MPGILSLLSRAKKKKQTNNKMGNTPPSVGYRLIPKIELTGILGSFKTAGIGLTPLYVSAVPKCSLLGLEG